MLTVARRGAEVLLVLKGMQVCIKQNTQPSFVIHTAVFVAHFQRGVCLRTFLICIPVCTLVALIYAKEGMKCMLAWSVKSADSRHEETVFFGTLQCCCMQQQQQPLEERNIFYPNLGHSVL